MSAEDRLRIARGALARWIVEAEWLWTRMIQASVGQPVTQGLPEAVQADRYVRELCTFVLELEATA